MLGQISNVTVSKPWWSPSLRCLKTLLLWPIQIVQSTRPLKHHQTFLNYLKNLSKLSSKKALTYRQSHPRIERNVAFKPIQDCYNPRSHLSYLTTLQVVMISKSLMFENFVVVIHPNSPKCKTLKTSSKNFKLLKKKRQTLIKKGIDLDRQSHPRIWRKVCI